LCCPSLISTLCRLVREGRLSSEDYRSLKSAVQADLSDADLCDLSQEAFEQTIRCLDPRPLAIEAHLGWHLVGDRTYPLRPSRPSQDFGRKFEV